MKKRQVIYLDCAAATPLDSLVFKAMQPYFSDKFFNPSAIYGPAREVKADYNLAKQSIAKNLGVRASELVMTAGVTESINLAFGSVRGGLVVLSSEHPAILICARAKQAKICPVRPNGLVDLEALSRLIGDQTELISLALVNSELGVIQPLAKVASLIKQVLNDRQNRGVDRQLLLHTDASQAIGAIKVNLTRLGVNLASLSAAKIYGPKQVGLLWADRHVKLEPQILGGGQERGLRGGTENVAGVVGFSRAIELAVKRQPSLSMVISKQRDILKDKLLGINGAVMSIEDEAVEIAPGYLSISFPGLDGERLVYLLEEAGILVATGSACLANKNQPSHVLSAIGLSDARIDGSLRITFGRDSLKLDMAKVAETMIKVINKEYERVSKCATL